MSKVTVSYAGGKFEVDDAEIELAKFFLRGGRSADDIADYFFRNSKGYYSPRKALAIVKEAEKRLRDNPAQP